MSTFPGRRRWFPAEALPEALAAAWHERTAGGEVLVGPGADGALLAWARDQGLPVITDAPAEPADVSLAEVPPVDLPCLPRSGVPPWPAVTDPVVQVQRASAWLAARCGDRLVLPTWPATPAFLRLAGALAGEGRRVLWHYPSAPDPAVLADIARRGWPLKLVIAAAHLPEPLPPGWWVAMSGDAHEVSAILAQHLRDEFPLVVALAPAAAPTWPVDQAWEPGQGRWLRPGSGPVTVCRGDGAAQALAGPGPVFQATSLAPQPPLPGGSRGG